MGEPLFKRQTQTGIAVALVALMLLLIQFGRPSPSGMWMSTLYESMHVLLFGVIALCVIVITPAHWQRRRRLLTIAIVVVALSLLSEAAQIPTDRDASMEDLVADWLGAAAFALIAISFSASFRLDRRYRMLLVPLGIVLLVWALLPLAKVSAAYVERDRNLPDLVVFDGHFSRSFMRIQNATLVAQRNATSGGTSALITLNDGAWPGVVLHDLYPNWSRFTALVIELENPQTSPLKLNLRVDDDKHRFGEQRYSDRYNLRFEVPPGETTLRIPLTDIENGPADRRMDLSAIDGLVLFAARSEAGRRFLIHSIRLE